jgi:hypothetical protein
MLGMQNNNKWREEQEEEFTQLEGLALTKP